MGLSLADQYALAMVQSDFRERVAAACFEVAALQLTTPAATGTGGDVITAQRMILANDIVRDPTYAAKTFAWVVVSRSIFDTRDDLTDAAIVQVVTAAFDAVARQLIPGADTAGTP